VVRCNDGQWEEDALTNFSDPCIGNSDGNVFIAFTATGARCGTKGLFVHYVKEGATVAVALEKGSLGAIAAHPGDSWKDFTQPSCSEKYVSFYADAGSSSGLYVSMVGRPAEVPLPDATIRAVLRNPNGTLWAGKPQVTGDSLWAMTEVGAGRICFSANLPDGSSGVFQADFEVPYPCATHSIGAAQQAALVADGKSANATTLRTNVWNTTDTKNMEFDSLENKPYTVDVATF